MYYSELKRANPGVRMATETLFGSRLDAGPNDPKRVTFEVKHGILVARMLVHHNSWRGRRVCCQYYEWLSDKSAWKETHILFDNVWPGD